MAALLAIGAALLVLAATRNGPAVSPDSASYLAAADNLVGGRGIVDFDGSPLTHWPPGYPVVLAGFGAAGLDTLDAARYLNAALAAVVVLLGYVTCRRHVGSAGLALLGTALIASAPVVLRTHDAVLSEPTFSVVVLGFVLLLDRAVEAASTLRLVQAGSLAGAGLFVRYLGVALIAAGIVALLWTTPRDDKRAALRRVGWFALAGAVPAALLAMRNVAVGDPPLGRQPDGSETLPTVAHDLVIGIGRFIVPDTLADGLTFVAGLALLVLIGACTVTALRAPDGHTIVPAISVVVCGVAVTFVGGVIAASDTSARILAPFFAPLVVCTLWWCSRLGQNDSTSKWSRALVAGGIALLALFVVWAAVLVNDDGRDPDGYLSKEWSQSELIRAVGGLPRDAQIFSNIPEAVSVLAARYPVKLAALPPIGEGVWRSVADSRAQLAVECPKPVFVAWFGTDAPNVGESRSFADGSLIEVECRT